MTPEDRLKAAFGKAMRKIREASGTSQERLADLAQLHRTYIGDVERGERNISLVNMGKIAKALNVSLTKLIRDMDKQC